MNLNIVKITGLFLASLAPLCGQTPGGPETVDSRIQELEQMMRRMNDELSLLKQQRSEEASSAARAEARAAQAEAKVAEAEAKVNELEANQQAMMETMAAAPSEAEAKGPILPEGLRLGAYGEHHYNFTETNLGNQSDIHRFVVYLGYEFTDWISFTSETELEHGYVEGGDGELILEQFYFDMKLDPKFNIRVGRVLHPAGIINRFHEPTSFYGVERPSYSALVLPSTWSIDGIGAFGSLTDYLSYESYLHAGLDGSQFNDGSGVRGGRLKERPGLEDFGVSSRADFLPLVALDVESDVTARWGSSYSYVGVENSDEGRGQGRSEGGVHIVALDTDLAYKDLELRGEWAKLFLTDAEKNFTGTTNEVGETVSGWYVQAAYHLWPEAFKSGRLKDSDFVTFIRYSELYLQEDLPNNTPPDLTENRDEITLGFSFYPIKNLVFKADYTFVDSEAGPRPNRTDLGVGYDF